MNRIFKIIGLATITALACYLAYFAYITKKYSYHINLRNYESYLWIFKDSAKQQINKDLFGSCTRSGDILSHYIYKDDFHINIWQFKELKSNNIGLMNISQNKKLNNIKFGSGEVLFKNSNPTITVKFGSFFRNHLMNVNLDQNSTLEKRIETKSYKGFYGVINKAILSDENGNPQVLFDFSKQNEKSLLLMYSGYNSFFVILIYSEKPFNEQILDIFNL